MNHTKESKRQIADPALETRMRAPDSEQLAVMAHNRRFINYTQGVTGEGPIGYNGLPNKPHYAKD